MRKIYFIFFAILLIIISCNTKKAHFFVKAPAGWVTTDSILKKSGRFVTMHPTISDTMRPGSFLNNINVSAVKGKDLNAYIDAVISEIKKNLAYYKEKDRGAINSDEYNGKWVQHVLRKKGVDDMLEQRVYFIQDYDNIYLIVCTAEMNDLDKIEKEIAEVLKSFKIL